MGKVTTNSTKLVIRKVAEIDQLAAMSRLPIFGPKPDISQTRQFFHHAKKKKTNLSHLWALHNESGQTIDVAFILPNTGRTGMAFISKPRRRGHVDRIANLLHRTCQQVPQEQVNLFQALLDPMDDLRLHAFHEAGFRQIAVLKYMQLYIRHNARQPVIPDNVRFSPYQHDLRPIFLQMLDASYENTLDCPQLHGLRDTDDVLSGHMQTSLFDPTLWTLMYVDNKPAGIMLLDQIQDNLCVELTYIGLAEKHRKKQLASLLLQRALWQCTQHNYTSLVLAVDEANTPAIRLYNTFGFRCTTSKTAMIMPPNKCAQ